MIEIRQIDAHETWNLRHRVMWPNKPLSYVCLPNDLEGDHYGLFVQEKLVSVISLFSKGESLQFRKFATCTHKQGKGYGTHLLSFVMDKVIQNTAISRIWCNARKDKTDFYKKLGLQETKECFFKL